VAGGVVVSLKYHVLKLFIQIINLRSLGAPLLVQVSKQRRRQHPIIYCCLSMREGIGIKAKIRTLAVSRESGALVNLGEGNCTNGEI
jgi:hypothetical protein